MTDTALNSLPDNDKAAPADRAREAVGVAQEKVGATAASVADAAREKPYATAGIVAGVAAAVAGAAYGVAKLREGEKPAKKASGSKTKK